MKLNQEFWVVAPDADGFGTHFGRVEPARERHRAGVKI